MIHTSVTLPDDILQFSTEVVICMPGVTGPTSFSMYATLRKNFVFLRLASYSMFLGALTAKTISGCFAISFMFCGEKP